MCLARKWGVIRHRESEIFASSKMHQPSYTLETERLHFELAESREHKPHEKEQ